MKDGILDMFDMKAMIDVLKQRQAMIPHKMNFVGNFHDYNKLANEYNKIQEHIDYLKGEILKTLKEEK